MSSDIILGTMPRASKVGSTGTPRFESAADYIRWLASRGGKARVKAMSSEELSAAATKAVRARWKKATKAERSAAASKASRARWAKKKRT